MTETKSRLRPQDCIWAASLLAISVFLFWRCPFGIANLDESFFLTIPYRLLQGDGLFAHEWHLSQLSSVLLLPFVWIYRAVNGGLEGIFLADRILCTVLIILCGIYIYFAFRKININGALFASLIFTLYVPFGIMALSYNSMGLIALLVCCLLIFSQGRHPKLRYFIAGIFLAAAVLCCPYLLILYLFYALSVCVHSAVCRKRGIKSEKSCDYTNFRGLLFITLGAALSALCFMAFMFSRVSPAEFIRALGPCLNDPEHPATPFIIRTLQYFSSILTLTDSSFILQLLIGAVFIVCLLDKKRSAHKSAYLIAVLIPAFALLISLYNKFHLINFLMWSFNLLAPFALLLVNTKQMRRIFSVFWVPGIIYSFCIHLASNQRHFEIFSASTLATVGSVLMVFILFRECLKEAKDRKPLKAAVSICLSLALILQLGLMINLRYRNVFWDKPVEEQTIYLNEGIYKGLRISQEQNQRYSRYMNAYEIIKDYRPSGVLFLSTQTWLYLLDDFENCGYSAWLSGVSDATLERLRIYYDFNPDKYPDLVFTESENLEYAQKFCKMFDYKIDYSDSESLILIKA